MRIDQFFYENPVFRFNEFAEWKTQHGSDNKPAIYAALQHYVKSGRLRRIRRELYAVIPPNEKVENFVIDPYLVAGKAVIDSIIGLHTALELHGVAYSSFEQFTYFSVHKTKPFQFQGQWFKPVASPTSLQKENILFEVENINRQNVNLKITSLARTFVDVLNKVDLCGGWEEVIRSISNIATLNIDRVIQYCCILENSILAAKVGYFLEQRSGAFAPSNDQINTLLKLKPSSPQYLSKKSREKCKLIKKWNLMIPMSILEKRWEEPEYDV